MLAFEVFRQQIPFCPLSPRAIVVHQPIAVCEARGFTPEFASD